VEAPSRRPFAIAIASFVLSTSLAHAQVVRGVVRDAETGAPVPGVVVVLDQDVVRLDTEAALRRASLVLAVLSNDQGEFAIAKIRSGRTPFALCG
jgi:hypothetical protein